MVARKVTKDYFDEYGRRNGAVLSTEVKRLEDRPPKVPYIPYETWLEEKHKEEWSKRNPSENPDRGDIVNHVNKQGGIPEVKKASERQAGGAHYKDFPIQPAEYCQKNKLGFMESNVIKYVSRHDRKGKAKDIKKAIHMLELLLEFEYGEQYTQGEEI